jgi:transposase InsO family protein
MGTDAQGQVEDQVGGAGGQEGRVAVLAVADMRHRPHDQRFEAVRPNHLWHLDFVQRFVNRASVFTLILLDDCSRFVVGHDIPR